MTDAVHIDGLKVAGIPHLVVICCQQPMTVDNTMTHGMRSGYAGRPCHIDRINRHCSRCGSALRTETTVYDDQEATPR